MLHHLKICFSHILYCCWNELISQKEYIGNCHTLGLLISNENVKFDHINHKGLKPLLLCLLYIFKWDRFLLIFEDKSYYFKQIISFFHTLKNKISVIYRIKSYKTFQHFLGNKSFLSPAPVGGISIEC